MDAISRKFDIVIIGGAIMGALTFSVLLSLIATPVVYRLLRR